MRRVARLALLLSTALSLAPASLAAQSAGPPGPFVVDVRGVFARYRQNNLVADELQITPANLPSRGFGLSAGAHWYPLHVKRLTLGIGGEWLMSRGSRALEVEDGATAGPTARTTLSAISPQVSFNFGGKNGWSYISGGIGRANLTLERTDGALPDGPWRKAINYGFGARWFTNERVAVSLDVRWYSIDPELGSAVRPLIPHMTMMVVSGGIALR